MSSTHLSPSLNFYKQAHSNNNGSVLAISVVSVSEKLVYRFRFIALCCLACFLNTRFTLPFASRVASAPIPVSLLGNGVVSLIKMLAFIGSTSTCPLTTPTKSHPHKFNYCDLLFAMPSALAKFAKVKFPQNIIALRYHNIKPAL